MTCVRLQTLFVALVVSSALVGSAAADQPFLSTWMGFLSPIIANQTLLQMSLPGTHDTQTYDLSTIASNGCTDDSEALSVILNELGHLVPGGFIRDQARTQGLTITQQLDAGVRFLDFRLMWELDGSWRCLHFVQTNQLSLTYLAELRTWLDAHPTEVVVIWLSKHGNPCATGTNQYPSVSTQSKEEFWQSFLSIFSGLLLDTRVSSLNNTTLQTLQARGHRLAVYAADYADFTGSSPYATDSCQIENKLNGSIFQMLDKYNWEVSQFQNATALKQELASQNRFFLMSMATSSPSKQIEMAAQLKYNPIDHSKHRKECVAVFNIPGMTECPPSLMTISQLTSYYNQLSLEMGATQGWDLPNAIYLDALDDEGTIRTDTLLLPAAATSTTRRYAYVDTFLLANINRVCGTAAQPQPGAPAECSSMRSTIEARRALFPIARWNDAANGRLDPWPLTSDSTIAIN